MLWIFRIVINILLRNRVRSLIIQRIKSLFWARKENVFFFYSALLFVMIEFVPCFAVECHVCEYHS